MTGKTLDSKWTGPALALTGRDHIATARGETTRIGAVLVIRLVLAVCVVALALTACGSTPWPSASSGSSVATTSSVAPPVTPPPPCAIALAAGRVLTSDVVSTGCLTAYGDQLAQMVENCVDGSQLMVGADTWGYVGERIQPEPGGLGAQAVCEGAVLPTTVRE